MEEANTKEVLAYDWQAAHREHMKNWRAWGSWYSWGSPVGLGLFFIEIAACLWLLHLANIIR